MPTNLRRLAIRTRELLAAQPASAWTVLALAAVAYLTLAATQWLRYQSPSWDLGIFTQIIQQYASFQPPIVHIKGADYNILGDHFHPILVLLAPVYAVLPSAFTLMACQALLLAVSAFFVTKSADLLLGRVGGLVDRAGVRVQLGGPAGGSGAIPRGRDGCADPGDRAVVADQATPGRGGDLVRAAGLRQGGPRAHRAHAGGVVLVLRTRRWLLGGLLSAWGGCSGSCWRCS